MVTFIPTFTAASYAEDLELRFNAFFTVKAEKKFDRILRCHPAVPLNIANGHALVERRTGYVFRYFAESTPPRSNYRFASVLEALSADVDIDGKYLEKLKGPALKGCEFRTPWTSGGHWICADHEMSLVPAPHAPSDLDLTVSQLNRNMVCPEGERWKNG